MQKPIGLAAVALIILCCALWGVQQVAVKVAAMQGLPPFFQAAARSLVAAILLACWVALRRGRAGIAELLAIDAATPACLLIGVMFAAEFLTLFPGLRLTTASRGVVFLYTAPFFTALGAHLLVPAERLGWRQALGLAIAFAGVAAAFAEGMGTGGGSLEGDALCLAGGALWGATTVVVKASPTLARVTASRVLFAQLAYSAPVLIAVAAVSGEWHAGGATPLAWACLLYQTVIVAFASYLAWFWLIQRHAASRIAGFTFLTPLFGILAGVLLLGERFSPWVLVGLAAIAVGLRLLTAPARSRRATAAG
jgi:drug/metabolite transporter (DMT)-like permease